MSKHRPLPWHTENERINVWDELGCLVARVMLHRDTPEKWEETMCTADFIVRACNAHDDLLEACEQLLALLPEAASPYWPSYYRGHPTVTNAEAAIAKAKGKS